MRNNDDLAARLNTPTDNDLRQNQLMPGTGWSPAAKGIGVAAICVASLLIGGFVLPSGQGSAAIAPEPIVVPPPTEVVVAPPPAPVVKAVVVNVPVAKPQAAIPPSKPNPLDAAPHVIPQLPTGPAYELATAVDREIDATLATAKVPASPLADDAEFLRRVTLDLTGTDPDLRSRCSPSCSTAIRTSEPS